MIFTITTHVISCFWLLLTIKFSRVFPGFFFFCFCYQILISAVKLMNSFSFLFFSCLTHFFFLYFYTYIFAFLCICSVLWIQCLSITGTVMKPTTVYGLELMIYNENVVNDDDEAVIVSVIKSIFSNFRKLLRFFFRLVFGMA